VRRAAKVLKKKDPQQLFSGLRQPGGKVCAETASEREKLSRRAKKRVSYTTAPAKPSRSSPQEQTIMPLPPSCEKLRLTISDYEFAGKFNLMGTRWRAYPEVVPNDRIERPGVTILKYPGIKEDVYLSRFRPDPELRTRIGVAPDDLLVTIRPPAGEAHYHNPESEALLTEVLNVYTRHPDARVLLLPRNKRQENELRAAWTDRIASGKILFPPSVEDGLNIIWNSDIVVSGGGTMNREAAAMGVPVYSIFRGTIGAVDRYLVDQGRLTLLERVEDVGTKINAVRRQKSEPCDTKTTSPALDTIVYYITAIAELKGRSLAEFNSIDRRRNAVGAGT
jgi:hypothetical protein